MGEQIQSSIEKKEQNGKFELLQPAQLQDIIYQGKNWPVDNRFFSTKDGGVFRFFSSRVFARNDLNEYKFPTVKEGGLIVALGELEKSPYDKNIIWVKSVAVDKKFRGKGYGKKIVDGIFKYAQDNNFTLQLSSFTDEYKHKESNNKIKYITQEIMKKYPQVKVLDTRGKKIN